MQPEPTDNFTATTNTNIPHESDNTSHHGLLVQQTHIGGSRDPLGNAAIASESPSGPSDAAGVHLSDGTEEQLRGLNLGDDNDTRLKPSFQRISEYEKALSPSPPRKQYEGPGFKIVKNKGHRLDAPQLASFPNGLFYLLVNIHMQYWSNNQQRF